MEPELADAIAIGNCTPILAQLSEPSGHEERMALAWCAQRRGDHERAVAILEEPLAKPLGQYARWIRAQSLVELSRTDEALTSLQDLALPGDAEWQVPLLRGKALVLANRHGVASMDVGTNATGRVPGCAG